MYDYKQYYIDYLSYVRIFTYFYYYFYLLIIGDLQTAIIFIVIMQSQTFELKVPIPFGTFGKFKLLQIHFSYQNI